MTQPSEEEVRAGLVTLAHTHPALGMLAVEALGLLDAGRKDRERVDWLEKEGHMGLGHHPIDTVPNTPVYSVAFLHAMTPDEQRIENGKWWVPTLRAAIDQARGA